jgi:hypothetical protein
VVVAVIIGIVDAGRMFPRYGLPGREGFRQKEILEKIKKLIERIKVPRMFVHLFRWSILKHLLKKDDLHQ